MRFLRQFFGYPRPAFNAPLRPDDPFVVVGDIHGCDSLLEQLLGQIATVRNCPDQVVFLGDYVDRGEQSAAVLHRLHALTKEAGAICLMGNHEQMMLDFLESPEKNGPRWLRYGGLQTLASFGLGHIAETSTEETWKDARAELRRALGPELEFWLRSLPVYWRSGNMAVVHAGADPRARLSDQTRRSLLWGHPDFLKVPRQDDLWVIHGHTIVENIAAEQGRIGIDTGAYATGRLSAAFVSAVDVEILTT